MTISAYPIYRTTTERVRASTKFGVARRVTSKTRIGTRFIGTRADGSRTIWSIHTH